MNIRLPMPGWIKPVAGYAVAILFTLMAVLLGRALPNRLELTPFLFFYPVVVVAAVLGGFGAGMIATLGGAAFHFLWFDFPLDRLGGTGLTRLAIFIVGGVGVSLLGHMQRRAQEAERRRGEDLRASEEKFRAIFEQSAVGMARVNFSDARWIDVNDAFCRMLGYDAEELRNTPWIQITHPDDRAFDLVPFHRVAEGELNDYTLEKRFVHKQGRPVWVQLTFSLVRNAQGAPAYGFAIIKDITGHKQAQEELRQSEQRLRGTFDNAGVGILESERNDHLIAVNGRACEILHRPCQDLLAMNVHQLTWPDDRALSDRLNAELQSGQCDRLNYEKRYIRGDGSPVWAHVTVSPIRDADGRWVRSISTIEDITERKRIEKELIAARQSAELAQATAESANQAKDRFLAVLSHELRTPLTPVVLGLSIIKDKPDLDPQMRETLEMIRNNVEMEARLIDDLLDVMRIARGKIELDRKPVDLRTVIRQAIEVCKPDIEQGRLHLDVDFGRSASCWVNADAARLQQVLWNLLKNAIKFTPRNGRVGIRCGQVDGYVSVEVNDSGIGIEPVALSKIFDAFEQAEPSITRQFGGLGLGLAISKALVEMHGGGIEAHSEGRGKGATFRIRLPLSQPARQPEVAESAPQRKVGPLRILLVEDHAATAQMIRMVLIQESHAVEIAGDVAAALELADRQAFDLLLSDLGLPDGNGYDLMRELRARGYTFPGIALSGYGREEDIRRSYEAGFAAHLIKPVSRESIDKAIASVLAGEQEAAPPYVPTPPQIERRLFDPDMALKRCFGKREVLENMIQFFRKDSAEQLSRMRSALDKNDFAEVGRAAHRLKGSTVYLGAQLATDATIRVEQVARSGDLGDITQTILELEHQVDLLTSATQGERPDSQRL